MHCPLTFNTKRAATCNITVGGGKRLYAKREHRGRWDEPSSQMQILPRPPASTFTRGEDKRVPLLLINLMSHKKESR